MHAKEYYEKFVLQQGFVSALKALDTLRNENDIIVIEGAGAPSEINIEKYDIANMLLAKKVGAPVIIVADNERGGCCASIVGTIQPLTQANGRLAKKFLIRKSRGVVTLHQAMVQDL